LIALRRARDDVAVAAPLLASAGDAVSWLAGWRAYALLALICLAVYLPGIAAMPVTDRDEARFAQATRQMLETGDFVNIRFQNDARNRKPVGVYWLQAASVAAFADAATDARWPYRLPSLLGALAATLFTFMAGVALFGRRVAFVGASALATSLLLVAEAHIAKTDAALLGATTAALAALACAYAADRGGAATGRGTAILFWAALGVGILLKGPITPMVAGLTVLALACFDRDRRWLRRLKPAIGVPLMLLVVLPWMIAIINSTGLQFFVDAIRGDLLPKLAGGQESHGAPPGLYLLLLPVAFWPGSLFLVPAAVEAWRRRREPAVLFALAWLVPTWLVFEAVPTKLPHYVLPAYPALALLVGAAIVAGVEAAPRRWIWLQAPWFIGVLAFGAAIVAAPFFLGGGFVPATVAAALALWIGAVLGWRALRGGHAVRAALATVASAAVALAIIFQLVLPRLDALWVSERVAAALARAGVDRAVPAVSVGFHEPSLVFMLGTGTAMVDNGAAAVRHLARTPGAVAIVEASAEAAFAEAAQFQGMAVATLDRVAGINYSNGRRIQLVLYTARRP
jgi:4-amino-4-deoxy-L-arabinose transferase-like glycosyltransferase